ncbi:MAG: DUF4430 domain-containing protein [Clostridia bacterium]|nr:DUF4430 domain-containing protein [Clostridia bacterium]
MKRFTIILILLLSLILLCSCFAQEHNQVLPEQTGQIEQTEQAEQSGQTLAEEQKPTVNTQASAVSEQAQQNKPLPAEVKTSAEQADSAEQLVCSLTVRCDNILNNIDDLAEEKHSLVPEDGVIYPVTELAFTEGETVFDVLLRAMKEAEIHFEFVHTPAYNSTYIEGINNLYEFDCGELSGWEYCVNGKYPAYGCSLYELQDGDVIEWHYTCDLGRDLDNFFKE